MELFSLFHCLSPACPGSGWDEGSTGTAEQALGGLCLKKNGIPIYKKLHKKRKRKRATSENLEQDSREEEY